MKKINLFFCALAASVALYSCGGSDSGSSDDSDYYESRTESDNKSYALSFKNSKDVCIYLNGKTFKGDGLSIAFSNYAQTVSCNGTIIANEVKISDIGVNENNVAYATVKIVTFNGGTTTLQLLAVDGHAQLIDPNDGTIYEY